MTFIFPFREANNRTLGPNHQSESEEQEQYEDEGRHEYARKSGIAGDSTNSQSKKKGSAVKAMAFSQNAQEVVVFGEQNVNNANNDNYPAGRTKHNNTTAQKQVTAKQRGVIINSSTMK